MKCVEKLEILNGMEFVEIDCTSEESVYVLYVLVEDNEHNRKEIGKIVTNPEQVFNDWGSNDKTIDVTRMAFENCCAGGFKNGKFVF